MLIIDYMFRASLCPSSGEKTMCYCIWVLAGGVGCGWLRCCGAQAAQAATFTVLTPYNVAPQHRNQPHPTPPAKTHMQ